MKKINKKLLIVALALFTSAFAVNAQEAEETSGVEISAGADLVSSYVWRGQYITSASFQPSVGISYAGFSLTAWGSSDFNHLVNEFDFTLGYGISGFSVAITDYFGPYDNEVPKYFAKGGHILEGTVGFDFASVAEKFPLTVTWNTNFLNDKTKVNDEGEPVEAYSTYIELGYPVTVGSVGLEFALGFTPWEGAYISGAAYEKGTTGFQVTNISIKGSKELKFTESFSLPVFAQLVLNPNQEAAHFVFGISF